VPRHNAQNSEVPQTTPEARAVLDVARPPWKFVSMGRTIYNESIFEKGNKRTLPFVTMGRFSYTAGATAQPETPAHTRQTPVLEAGKADASVGGTESERETEAELTEAAKKLQEAEKLHRTITEKITENNRTITELWAKLNRPGGNSKPDPVFDQQQQQQQQQQRPAEPPRPTISGSLADVVDRIAGKIGNELSECWEDPPTYVVKTAKQEAADFYNGGVFVSEALGKQVCIPFPNLLQNLIPPNATGVSTGWSGCWMVGRAEEVVRSHGGQGRSIWCAVGQVAPDHAGFH
jgi:hypothetical protein